jgi:hypothetical protein
MPIPGVRGSTESFTDYYWGIYMLAFRYLNESLKEFFVPTVNFHIPFCSK